jgi:DNA-binding SARP family transcriptional activator
VLAVLLLHANDPVPTSRIIDAVWGDEPPLNGPNVVQKHISGLRSVLAGDDSPRAPGHVLALTDAGYRLRVAPGSLDLDVFQGQVTRSHTLRRAGQLNDAVATLRDALALWRGSPLSGLSGVYFDAEQSRLAELRANAYEAALEMEVELGHHAEAVPELIRLVAEFPFREGLRSLLMLALYRAGRPAEALDVFRQARRYLADKLGIEPSERVQRLHDQILAADPSIAGPTGKDGSGTVRVPATPASQNSDPRLDPMPVPATPAPEFSAPENTAPRPIPAGPPLRTRLFTLTTLVVLPLASFGMLTWSAMAYAAIRLRSWAVGAAAAGYFALVGMAFYLVRTPAAAERHSGYAAGIILLSMTGGAVHGVLLRDRLHWMRALSTDPVIALALRRRSLRRQAVELLRRDPALAKELRIGRPDLSQTFDDGGLVDLNAVPETVLAGLPGISAEQARQIVLARAEVGGFATPDELVSSGVLAKSVVDGLRDRLIVLR